MTTNNRYMTFRGAILTAEIRTAQFDDHEHLVMPVVALVGDVVVRPLNSTGPEFVPADVLAMAPGGWAGRPVVANHPAGGTASANEPRTLEEQAFGLIFNPEFSDNRLRVEAWVDPIRVAKVGGDSERVLETAQAAMAGEQVEPLEVSIGAWVSMEEVSGISPSGEPFEFRWAVIVPDHLAVGLEGSQGACSVDMGCGGPRVASAAKPTKNVAQMRAAKGGTKVEQPNFLQRIIDKFRINQEDGTSDDELRNNLWSALNSVEPGFEWIEAVFQETGKVVYAVFRDEMFMLFRRSFEMADNGEVTLGEEAEQVEETREFTPVAARAADDQTAAADGAASCSCGNNQPKAAQEEGVTPMTEKVTKLVDGLVACDGAPFTEDNREVLTALPEEALEALSAKYLEEEAPTEGAAGGEADEEGDEEEGEGEGAAPTEETVTLSKPEYDEVMELAAARRKEVAKQKKSLVAILSKAQAVYPLADLQAMGLEQLQGIAKLLKEATPDNPIGGPDFTGMGMPDPPDVIEVVAPPKPWTAAREKDQSKAN